jgi:hypothetical protein
MIRECLLIAAAAYLAITFFQAVAAGSVAFESLVFAAALAGLTGFFWVRDDHLLHRAEAAALWAAILLFALYAAAKLWGFV